MYDSQNPVHGPGTDAPAKRRMGFGSLTCPKCCCDGVVMIHLDDFENFCCGDCSEEFTLSDVRELIAGWNKVIAWIDEHAPTRP